ncbi:MAG: glycosyltransferase N-terminal domain-containing protein [Pseudomonadota bacterium]|nr:MAG: 3-deoxy-D-manno-octulosonic acid transferase [Pseudomonadota bacterium]
MARFPIDKARLNRFAGRFLARYVDFVYRTSRVVSEPADLCAYVRAHSPFILAMWHGQFLMLPRVERGGVRVHSMVARHGDAELIGQVLEHFGMDMIRGAGAGTRRRNRGGAYALRAALRALANGDCVAMTADVPPGPARVAGLGIVTLARLSGCPIIPAAAATTRYKAFDTWSRMTLNLPFGTLAVVLGEPIHVDRDDDEERLEKARLKVQDALNTVTARAYDLAGADPTRATPPPVGRDAPPIPPGVLYKSYRVLTGLAQPAASLWLDARTRRGKEDRARRSERFGQASIARPDGCLVWVHAASVGETNAILPLLAALRARRPDVRFLLTTGTLTSAAIASTRLGPNDIHQYVPLDLPKAVQGFLDHWRPQLAIFTESEIWPNLIMETSARSIPMALVNARMSSRSYARWRRWSGLAKPMFSRFDIVLAQNEKLARQFGNLGARNVFAAGNLKIDAPAPAANPVEVRRLREALGERPCLVAASTHEGEEEIIGLAHKVLCQKVASLCTILVPRHPDRGGRIAEVLREQGLEVSRRSLGAVPEQHTDVYIADTLGELGTFYSLAPLAFIGGSLVPRGGQNPVEAIRHGAVVLTGPYWANFVDAYRALFRRRAALQVHSAESLARAVGSLINDEVELARMRASAQAALEELSGALDRTVEALLPLLPDKEGLRRAS